MNRQMAVGLPCALLLAAGAALAPAARAAGTGALDPAKTDLCAAVPGAAVAERFGGQLKTARPFTDPDGGFARCTYLVTPKAAPAETVGYSLWLYAAADYDELLAATEAKVETVKDLGDAAVLFHDEDGRWKLRFVVRGRYALEATAPDAESAKSLARLALGIL